MSFEHDDTDQDDGAQVIDEENRISNRLKDRILDARDRVAEREDDIFVGAKLNGNVALQPGEPANAQLTDIWATTVRQYLKTIEPLLRSEEIEDAHYYYEELPIVDTHITPTDGETVIIPKHPSKSKYTEHIRWSLFYDNSVSNTKLVRGSSKFGSHFEPPEPRRFTIRGLKDLIDQPTTTFTWNVELDPDKFGPQLEIARPQRAVTLRHEWLEMAVRKADQFLQNAGIGLEVGDPTKEASGDYSDIEDIDQL
jgi:hypothetical protein